MVNATTNNTVGGEARATVKSTVAVFRTYDRSDNPPGRFLHTLHMHINTYLIIYYFLKFAWAKPRCM